MSPAYCNVILYVRTVLYAREETENLTMYDAIARKNTDGDGNQNEKKHFSHEIRE